MTDSDKPMETKKKYTCHDVVTGKAKSLNVVAQIAQTDDDLCTRLLAIELITDQTVLRRIAESDAALYIRRMAVLQLTDQTVITQIAESDAAPDTRRAARYRLAQLVAK